MQNILKTYREVNLKGFYLPFLLIPYHLGPQIKPSINEHNLNVLCFAKTKNVPSVIKEDNCMDGGTT